MRVSGDSAEKSRGTSPETTEDQLEALVEGSSGFSIDLYRTLVESEEGNLFFSPYSISLTLAMAYAGARGETEVQMADVFRFDLP